MLGEGCSALEEGDAVKGEGVEVFDRVFSSLWDAGRGGYGRRGGGGGGSGELQRLSGCEGGVCN